MTQCIMNKKIQEVNQNSKYRMWWSHKKNSLCKGGDLPKGALFLRVHRRVSGTFECFGKLNAILE